MSLVQIGQSRPGRSGPGGNRPPKQLPLRTEAAITSDKLFTLGMIAGFIGSVAVGAYLWLGLNGQLPLPAAYVSLRSLHASLQLHFFMGAFIAGFLLQGAPRILESRRQVHRASRYVFPLLVIGMLARVAGFVTISSILTFGAFAGALLCLAPVLLSCAPDNFWRMATPCAVSLASLAIGVPFDMGDTHVALAVFWWGIVSVILGIAQQFIGNILGGFKLTRRQVPIVSVLFLGAGAGLLGTAAGYGAGWWSLFAWCSLGCFLAFTVFTRVYRGFFKADAFSRCFALCWVWAFAGSLVALQGPAQADLVLHGWGAGLAVTMIIAVSSRVVSHVTSIDVLPPSLFYGVCLLWQLVPLGRSLRGVLNLPAGFSWWVGVAAAVVLLVWMCRIGAAIIGLIRRLKAERAAAAVQ